VKGETRVSWKPQWWQLTSREKGNGLPKCNGETKKKGKKAWDNASRNKKRLLFGPDRRGAITYKKGSWCTPDFQKKGGGVKGNE